MPSLATVAHSRQCTDVRAADAWRYDFPSPEMVDSAAGLIPRVRSWSAWSTARPGVEWFAHAAPEGPRWRLIVSPGVLTVTHRDPARVERAVEVAHRRRRARVQLEAVELLLPERLTDEEGTEQALVSLAALGAIAWDEVARCSDRVELLERVIASLEAEAGPAHTAGIILWSRKSRANMRKVFAQLDYGPLFDQGIPAMVTLTYPGEWETVAPDAATCQNHMRALRKRFARKYGRPLLGTWKREFQRRGAPHYHLLMVPPIGFRAWLGPVWADIVGATGDERERHIVAGTGVDYREGMKCTDPARLATYFAKHGLYGAKDYQNDAPRLWVDSGSVGRFWGVWGLEKKLATVEVAPDVALAAARTMRRWFRAQKRTYSRPVWRKVTTIDGETGELGWKWRQRKSTSRYVMMRQATGFLVLNDGPNFTAQLSRYLDQVEGG